MRRILPRIPALPRRHPRAENPPQQAWRRLAASLLTLTCSMTTGWVHGAWTLDNDASALNFISTKESHIAETHTFDRLAGGIDDAGQASVTIDLTSVNTGIGIRNQRMQSMLFNAVQFPQAQINAVVDVQSVNDSNATILPITATLNLAGASTDVTGQVIVSPAGPDAVTVTTVAPIVVTASSLNLESGIDALRDIAGLPSISYSVPVTFSLTFKR